MAVKETAWRSDEIILSPEERTVAFIAKLKNRTPEEIAEARAQSTAGFPPPRPLPPGKTLEDVFVGALPDDEDDAVIIALLEEMD